MKRHPRLSLDLLRAFRAAAAHLSFTRAAQEISVTQSAISRAVRTIEEQLGQPLFHRVNRALKLTHAGEALYRATDEALALIDSTTERLMGSDRRVAVTTTAALASLWLAPKLRSFARAHAGTDVRVVATNERVDLEREHLDLAIHFVPAWEAPLVTPKLVDYLQFPVCSPALARRLPLRTPADLARHVRLDFETIVYGRPWYDWEHWTEAMDVRALPASTMRFSHYDQVIQAAVDGAGVAIGKWPHLAQKLHDGVLCAPLGSEWVARLGAFHFEFARDAGGRSSVRAFVAWLRDELAQDARHAPAFLRRHVSAKLHDLRSSQA